jgi:hypothetical protein
MNHLLQKMAACMTLALVSSSAGAVDRSAIWQNLKEVDIAFAEDTRKYGIAEAFLKHLSEEAVIFRRGPVNARQLMEELGSEAIADRLLESRAHYFDFSRAGDMAVIAGAFRNSQGVGKETVKNHGYFITIWQQTEGQWTMDADISLIIPGYLSLEVEPALQDTDLASAESPDHLLIQGNSFQSVLEAESRFVSAVNYRGGRRAMLRYGLENQRVYVPGMAPAVGADSGALAYGMFLDDTLSMDLLRHESAGGGISASGEFAYTFGTMGSENSSFATNYLRVWRFTHDHEWKIAIEVLRPY